MLIEYKDVTSVKKFVGVEIPADAVDHEFKHVLDEFARHAKIPGFRAGTVPRAVVRTKFDDDIKREVLDRLLPKFLRDAIVEKGLEAVGTPELKEVAELTEGSPLRFDAELEDVRLIDFGIAVRRGTYVAPTAAPDALAGTPSYIAPEQTGRMNRHVDTRADLYSLGVTLYQMVTGALPFEVSDLAELIHTHIARSPTPPHERAPERRIPAVVSAIVLKLMAKNPDDRYQTAEGAAFDLERAAHQWSETGDVPDFELATHDWEDRVRKPSRLFGREQETALL